MDTPSLTLLFDGECPLCVKEVAFLRRRDRAGRLAFTDIAGPGFDPAVHGLTQDEVMARMHAVTEQGEVVDGVEVFRRAYRAVGLGWLVAPTSWPLLRPLFDLAYRVFARYRVPIGRLFGRGDCVDGRCQVDLSARRRAPEGAERS